MVKKTYASSHVRPAFLFLVCNLISQSQLSQSSGIVLLAVVSQGDVRAYLCADDILLLIGLLLLLLLLLL